MAYNVEDITRNNSILFLVYLYFCVKYQITGILMKLNIYVKKLLWSDLRRGTLEYNVKHQSEQLDSGQNLNQSPVEYEAGEP